MIIANWAYAPHKRFQGSLPPSKQYGNVFDPTPLPWAGTKRQKRCLMDRVSSLRKAVEAGKMTQLEALDNLRKAYKLGLRDSVLLLRGEIQI